LDATVVGTTTRRSLHHFYRHDPPQRRRVGNGRRGIANRTTFGYRRWRWDEIDHFRHVGSRVYLVTRDLKAWQLAGVNERWRNIWEDGETRAITELLNQRLTRRGSAVVT
jgi:hypothetical protein